MNDHRSYDPWLDRVLFWLLAIIPMVGIIIISGFYGSFWFVVFLMVYVLIYRPVLHIIRLLKLGKIEEKDAWKFFIPFYGAKYIRSLWLG